MPAIALVMGKKEGCNKMGLKTHFVTAPFLLQEYCRSYRPFLSVLIREKAL